MTGLVVSHNTKDLLKTSIESIEKFYPDVPILVIDSSTDECYDYVQSLPNKVHFDFNIGHGKGMNIGITMIDDEEILIFDSDIEMKSPCLDEMRELLDDDTYGVGKVYEVTEWGYGKTPCLHPYFHLIKKSNYLKYMPYIHSGAPTILANLDVHFRGMSHILKNFPVDKYVEHRWRGTRDLQAFDGRRHYRTQTLARKYFG